MIHRFENVEDPIYEHMAKVMISFLAGLFVGGAKFEEIRDNLDLERCFACPGAMSGGFTVIVMREFVLFKTGRR